MSIAVKYNFTENTSAVLTYDDYDHNTTAPDNVFVSNDPLSQPLLWEQVLALRKQMIGKHLHRGIPTDSLH